MVTDPYKKEYILKRIQREGSFEDNYPERALDWDYDDERNQPYKPSDFLSGSNRLVYWKGHVCGYKGETPTTILSHAKAMFPCEKCAIAGRTSNRYGEEPIVKTNPELLQEWDFERNDKDGIFPENITNHNSKTQIHWVCKRGHHWRKSVSYRLHNTLGKCPKCQAEIHTSFPEQAIFFYLSRQLECINAYPLKNNSHIDIYIPSKKIGIEYDGPRHNTHSQKERDERKNQLLQDMGIKLYRVIQSDRFSVEGNSIHVIYDNRHTYLNYAIEHLCNFIEIPFLSFDIDNNRTAITESYLVREKENSLAKLYPGLLEEWDYEKNGHINPECISYGSGIKLYWKCKNGHSWKSAVYCRTKGLGCPYCAGKKLLSGLNDFKTVHPELLDEWDYNENEKKGITPQNITYGNSSIKVFWICKNNPEHKWTATVASRVRGTGCIFCAEEQRKVTKRKTYIEKNGSFAENHPELLNDWLYEKNDELNIFPDKIPTHYSEKVWWQCHVCAYKWQATPDNRANGKGCQKCVENNHSQTMKKVLLNKNGSLFENNPDVANFWDNDNNDLTPYDITAKCHETINWKCPKCGYKWVKRVYKMTQYPCCPQCKYSLNEVVRPIIQYDLSLNEIARYNSPKEASEKTKIARPYILNCARHNVKSTHGFVFRYEDDDSDMISHKSTIQPTPKAVLQYTKTGEFVKEWDCISKAEIEYSIAHGKISSVCKGQRKSAGGYIWKYKETDD